MGEIPNFLHIRYSGNVDIPTTSPPKLIISLISDSVSYVGPIVNVYVLLCSPLMLILLYQLPIVIDL